MYLIFPAALLLVLLAAGRLGEDADLGCRIVDTLGPDGHAHALVMPAASRYQNGRHDVLVAATRSRSPRGRGSRSWAACAATTTSSCGVRRPTRLPVPAQIAEHGPSAAAGRAARIAKARWRVLCRPREEGQITAPSGMYSCRRRADACGPAQQLRQVAACGVSTSTPSPCASAPWSRGRGTAHGP